MGLILDSSLLIAGERRGQRIWDILERAKALQGETECGLSVVTVVELVHGIYRAKSEADAERRRAFVEELCQSIPVQPVTLEIAQLAVVAGCGRIGTRRSRWVHQPPPNRLRV